MGAFEDFVNTELPLRTNVAALPTANRYPRFTGVGRAVEERTPAQVLADIAAAAADHDAQHVTGGGDKIRDATAAVDGLATAPQITKLDGIEAGANDYTHPNHTGDVTSVADGATTLATKYKTRSFLVEIPDPADDDEFIVHWFPHAATLTQVRVHVEAATSVTFDLTERGYDTPDSGGTDISASPITATTTPTDVTMNNTGMAANSVLVYRSSAVSGTPGKVWIFGKYTID